MKLLEEIQQKHLLAEIDDGLTKSINEELGIASNVIYATNNLYNRLKEVISKSQSLPFNSDYVVFKKGITEYKDNYINLYVNWNYYNYLNQHSFEKYYRGLNASYTPYNNTLESKWELDTNKQKLIKEICEKTDSKIVISSSWRRYDLKSTYDGMEKWHPDFPYILKEYTIDVTTRRCPYGYMRGYEIKYYLEQHPDVTNYLILDDDTDMLDEQKEHFIKTDTYNGISEDNVNKTIKILNDGKN